MSSTLLKPQPHREAMSPLKDMERFLQEDLAGAHPKIQLLVILILLMVLALATLQVALPA